MNSEKRYEDIINLPHHTSEKRSRMPLRDRAAQFSPFAALTGHSAALQETARLTDAKAELDESEKIIINEKLRFIINSAEKPLTAVTYFVPDGRKSGGTYLRHVGCLKKVDSFRREITMTDGTVIPIDNISDIEILAKNTADGELYL